MAKRFKKPKPLTRRKLQNELAVANIAPGGITVGFPEFWPKVHNQYSRFFAAVECLMPLVNQVLSRPYRGQLQVVLHFITGIAANSFGALITLSLNGYGHDAVRISRGMYEAAVTAAYLKLHPEEIRDFLDYHWVRQRGLLDYMEKHHVQGFARLQKQIIDETRAEFDKVAPRFKNSRGDLRGSWSKKSIRKRAEEVGLGELYPTFYSMASSIHHCDISGLSSQAFEDRLEVDTAPSLRFIEEALMMGHQCVLTTIAAFNEVAGFGLEKEIEKANADFMNAWKS